MDITKLLPLIVMAGIGNHFKDNIAQQIEPLLYLQKSIVTEHDMNVILRQANLESIGEVRFQIPDLQRFISTHLEANPLRDVTVDAWGTPYQHQIDGLQMTITSAGADKLFGSADDLVATGSLTML